MVMHFLPNSLAHNASPVWALEKILSFRCPSEVTWAPDASHIACVLKGRGKEELCLINLSEGKRILLPLASSSAAKMWGSVEPSYVWHPKAKALLYVSEGIWIYDLQTGQQKKLISGEEPVSHPSWAPDGRRFAFRQGNRVGLYDLETSSFISFSLPGVVYKFAPHLRWSPDGDLIVVAFRRSDPEGKLAKRGLDLAVISTDGKIIWSTDNPGTVANPQWVDEERLLFTRYNETYTVAEHVLIHIPTGAEQILLVEEEHKGFLPDFVEGLGSRGPFLSPRGDEAVLVCPADGWPHLHLLDLRSGDLRQITYGEGEDTNPTWSPDGHYIAYLSNKGFSLASLEVWVLNIKDGTTKPIFSSPGAKGELTWSPQKLNKGRTSLSLAFLHAGPGKPPSLWITELNSQSIACLVSSEGILGRDFPPREVWIKATDGRLTPGLLYTRPNLRKKPGIIWLHGGPYMQYYLGWPIDYGYCMYYAFHQLLVQQGYSVLYLNYRGSTGYGIEHEQGNYLGIGIAELADIAGAADFLSSLPQVEGQSLCIAGTSYGGFLALSALVRLPDLFRLGIVISGLGDVAGSLDTSDFWDDTAYFRWRMGWSAEQNPYAWQRANALADIENLKAPLVIFHGMEDQAVPVEEAFKIERTCRELGKKCFAHYYPGEDHVFSSEKTWHDVFTCILRYLKEFVG